MTQEQMDKINDILKENKNVNEFILDFILRFRFPNFAINTIDDKGVGALLTYKATENIAKSYKKDADKMIDKYKKNVRNINEKQAKTYCENDDLLGLKAALDNEKKSLFDKILNQYRNIDSYGYTSGKISDFMLYDLYMDYITDDEIFYYDDDNPYVVELFYNINNFIRMRSRIELNCSNIDGLLSKFKKLCDKRLKQFFTGKDKDYYGNLKERFKYDFYTDDEEELIESTIDGKKRVTLYSKVLDYLKVLTKYQKPQSASEKYAGMDAESVINSEDKQSDSEKKNEELLKDLKKIAITFVNLRKIEVDNSNYSYFSEYISKDDLNDVFTLRDILAVQLVDIKEYSTYTADPKLLASSGILKKYLGALRGITQNEAKILKDLSDKAINWYLTNGVKVDDGTIFDEFKEINWSSPSTIFRNDEGHDFFFLVDEDEKTGENGEDPKKDNTDGYQYGEDSIKTKYGINSLPYWLKYCTVATLVNCMLPMYWPTGFIAAGAPVKLPIIFIPFVVLSGRVITVIGLGLCGICPMPMVLFMNVGDVPGFIIPTMNIAVDMLKKLAEMSLNLGMDGVKQIVVGLIKAMDMKINDISDRIQQIDIDIHNMNAGIEVDKSALRDLKKSIGKNPTTTAKKGGD